MGIDRVKCWIGTERMRQVEVLNRETDMVLNVKTTATIVDTVSYTDQSMCLSPAIGL